MKQISITKALVELKTIDSRISKAVEKLAPVCISKGDRSTNVNGMSITEFGLMANSRLQSINALIKYRKTIKSQIVASNAVTMVNVGGVDMTVADAIERKNSIEYEQTLLKKLTNSFAGTTQMLTRANTKVEGDLQGLLMSKGTEAKAVDIEEFTASFMKMNEHKLVDPIGVEKQIEKLDSDIDLFLTEVDVVLSESNAITKITTE